MPLHFFYARITVRALPNARILRLRRQPMDSCVSHFRQLFATGFSYYDYAVDTVDSGRYYVWQFERQMAALWRLSCAATRCIGGRVVSTGNNSRGDPKADRWTHTDV